MTPGLQSSIGSVAYVLLALLPGLAVTVGLGYRHRDPFVTTGLALGLGLALLPVVVLWADVLGAPMGAVSYWLLLAVSAVVLAAIAWRARCRGREPTAVPDPLAAGCFLVTLVAVAVSRGWAIRGLEAPLWGDSVHHAMIVELLARNAGLVAGWRPLAELSTFTYHYGLHSGVAALGLLSGLPAHQALLIGGQVLSVMGVVTSYALAAGLTGRPWAGVGAALAAGGLSTMPAYYLNWGRYTQLAGQVVLPAAALAAVWCAARASPEGRDGLEWRATALAGIAAAGLFLTHYLVALFFALFLVAWFVVGPSPERRRSREALRLAAVAATSAVVLLPWFPQLARGSLDDHAVRLATSTLPNPDVAGVVAPSYVWGSLDLHVGWAMAAASVVCAAWAIARRERLALLGLSWAGLMLLAAYPGLVGLSVTGLLKDFTVVIGLYVPAGLLVGGCLGDWMRLLGERSEANLRWAAVAVAALAAALAWKDADVVVPDNAYVTAADVAAMGWIRENTAATAVFLAGTVPAFGETIVVGEDAGWWLPLLAERKSTAPPATVGTELGYGDYRERLNRLSALWHDDLDSPETRAALAMEGVTHAYVGPRAGRMRELGLGGELPGLLGASPHWRLVYDQGGARVYELLEWE